MMGFLFWQMIMVMMMNIIIICIVPEYKVKFKEP